MWKKILEEEEVIEVVEVMFRKLYLEYSFGKFGGINMFCG